MKYKIIGDVNISGKVKDDTFDAEPHAMELYLKRGDVREVSSVEKVIKKLKKK